MVKGHDQNKPVKKVRRSQGAEIWYRFRKNKTAMLGLAIVIALALLAVFADVIFDYQTQIAGLSPRNKLLPPSMEHPFGTDNMGRDLFCRVLYGTRYSLLIGILAVALGTAVAVIIGSAAGYIGGLFDDIVMRIIDIVSAVPAILLGIVIVSALGANITNLIIAISITNVPVLARITRAQIMVVKEQEFVEAARCCGLRQFSIITRHILPNCLSPILVQVTLGVASSIIAASSLSFLGLGVPVPSPEWGALLSAGRSQILTHSYLTLFPGLAIVITVLAFNMLGDGLRDAMDPKLRK